MVKIMLTSERQGMSLAVYFWPPTLAATRLRRGLCRYLVVIGRFCLGFAPDCDDKPGNGCRRPGPSTAARDR